MKFDKKVLKKSLIIITLIFACITIYKIISTYALFESKANSTIENSIGKWNIEINKEDITTGATKEIIVNDFTILENENVKEGKIAPGVCGEFDLTLDAKDTDVSVRYDISIGDTAEEQVTIESVSLKSGSSGTLVKTGENAFTGVMKLLENTKAPGSATVTIKVMWENNEANNEKDTEIGTQSGYKLEVPIKVTVSQYLGEEIKESV